MNLETLDENLVKQLEDRAADWGFNSVEKFLKAVASDPEKFKQGVRTPTAVEKLVEATPVPKMISYVHQVKGGRTPQKTVLFQVRFECSPEFLDAFDAAAKRANRTRFGQAKQLAEDFAGQPALVNA